VSIKSLRKVLRFMIHEEYDIDTKNSSVRTKHTGAGIVVLKKFKDKEYRVLCLKTSDGKYDLPKGKMDLGETVFAAALRETAEEAGIRKMTFPFGRQAITINDRLAMFIGITTQDGQIEENPSTGILEHEEIVWMKFDDALESVIDFLVPSIVWAKGKMFEKTGNVKYKYTSQNIERLRQ